MTNGSVSYKLGKLTQAVEDMQKDVKVLKADVKSLTAWKWKVVGVVSVVAVMANVGLNIFLKKI